MDSHKIRQLESFIEKVQHGSREEFRGIVDLCLQEVRAFVTRRSLPGSDIDDVVQRVFIEAYQRIGDYKLGSEFMAWLISIAKYQAMMESSKLRRLADYHSRYVPRAVADENERRLSNHEIGDQRLSYLKECLQKIPIGGREILDRRYQKNESSKDIATALKRSDGAVRKQLSLLRNTLHECVSQKMTMGNSYGS
ncbi:MAG: sigma-70 family RNA polymerase sigma factor [Planctomycetota bacterium]